MSLTLNNLESTSTLLTTRRLSIKLMSRAMLRPMAKTWSEISQSKLLKPVTDVFQSSRHLKETHKMLKSGLKLLNSTILNLVTKPRRSSLMRATTCQNSETLRHLFLLSKTTLSSSRESRMCINFALLICSTWSCKSNQATLLMSQNTEMEQENIT